MSNLNPLHYFCVIPEEKHELNASKCGRGKKVHNKHEGLQCVCSIVALNLFNPLITHAQHKKRMLPCWNKSRRRPCQVHWFHLVLCRFFCIFILSLLSDRVERPLQIHGLSMTCSWKWARKLQVRWTHFDLYLNVFKENNHGLHKVRKTA